jgi:hypothetical protein
VEAYLYQYAGKTELCESNPMVRFLDMKHRFYTSGESGEGLEALRNGISVVNSNVIL